MPSELVPRAQPPLPTAAGLQREGLTRHRFCHGGRAVGPGNPVLCGKYSCRHLLPRPLTGGANSLGQDRGAAGA